MLLVIGTVLLVSNRVCQAVEKASKKSETITSVLEVPIEDLRQQKQKVRKYQEILKSEPEEELPVPVVRDIWMSEYTVQIVRLRVNYQTAIRMPFEVDTGFVGLGNKDLFQVSARKDVLYVMPTRPFGYSSLSVMDPGTGRLYNFVLKEASTQDRVDMLVRVRDMMGVRVPSPSLADEVFLHRDSPAGSLHRRYVIEKVSFDSCEAEVAVFVPERFSEHLCVLRIRGKHAVEGSYFWTVYAGQYTYTAFVCSTKVAIRGMENGKTCQWYGSLSVPVSAGLFRTGNRSGKDRQAEHGREAVSNVQLSSE